MSKKHAVAQISNCLSLAAHAQFRFGTILSTHLTFTVLVSRAQSRKSGRILFVRRSASCRPVPTHATSSPVGSCSFAVSSPSSHNSWRSQPVSAVSMTGGGCLAAAVGIPPPTHGTLTRLMPPFRGSQSVAALYWVCERVGFTCEGAEANSLYGG